ncbi:MAG: hypothetical protein ACLTDC_02935 [Lachnospiraceae bacterium]
MDMAVLLFCIRSRILVSDYGLNEKINLHAHSSNYMINNQIHASTKSMLGESDIFLQDIWCGYQGAADHCTDHPGTDYFF